MARVQRQSSLNEMREEAQALLVESEIITLIKVENVLSQLISVTGLIHYKIFEILMLTHLSRITFVQTGPNVIKLFCP
jgi:hypothetical protein